MSNSNRDTAARWVSMLPSAATVAEMIGEHGPAVVAQIRKWWGQTDAADTFPLTEAGDAECFAAAAGKEFWEESSVAEFILGYAVREGP